MNTLVLIGCAVASLAVLASTALIVGVLVLFDEHELDEGWNE